MATDMTFIKALVVNILQEGMRREWTVQGFGFLRTYFGSVDNPKRYRLNLWDSQFTVPNVSTIHDHPWDFKSLIVAGEFENQRYAMTNAGIRPTHEYATLKTGIEGGSLGICNVCILIPQVTEYYFSSDTYFQKANEIHETKFKDGSVTLNERVGDTAQARVFWPYGTNWVDAKPRLATKEEVDTAITKSLEYWF